jgi:Tfp pilus assembly protein PilF
MPKSLRKVPADEFARRLCQITKPPDKRFALFLGAGCSVSSGIPASASLVKDNWLPRLRDLCAPARKDLEQWAKEALPNYDAGNPAASYGDVMDKLFLIAEERQREVESLCGGRFPGFGYACLAQLMALDGGRFNVALTTNFDDLIPDALYLFTEARPLVIYHESLASFIRPTRTRPLVVKLHGDHRLSPHNTRQETEELKEEIGKQVRTLLHDRGLILVGYGGNDQGISDMLKGLPAEALPLGVFWVSGEEPDCAIRPWLEERDALWVEKGDFDELMLLIRDVFELPHPERRRFDEVFEKYKSTYEKLSGHVLSLPGTAPDAEALRAAVERADDSLPQWSQFLVRAERVKTTKPDEAEQAYLAGLKRFPHSAPLLAAYALFLTNIRKDHDRAEEFYRRAIDADPKHATILGNYALFLQKFREDHDRAEEFYRRAVDADPKHANNLGNYAVFLTGTRKDHDRAEEFYRLAVDADPKRASILGNYAIFLKNIRNDYDRAQEYYRRAIDADPKDATILGNYATFLYKIRKDHDRAEEYYRRAIESDPKDPNTKANYSGFLLAQGRKEGLPLLEAVLPELETSGRTDLPAECWFYAFAHRPADMRGEALTNLKKTLVEGARSPGWDFSANIARAREENHPDAEWLEKLAAVISEGADIASLAAWPAWVEA